MSQTALLLSSPVALTLRAMEGSHISTFGRSIEQFRKSFARRISLKSKKTSGQIHGQSATQISVVIPTCRRPHLLQRCLQALVEQGFDKNFYEIIVVSDGPDGATKNIVSTFKQFHPAIY